MNKEIIIYHHLGLGDHISCHGIVRHYCETHDTVYLFVKPQNYNNVRYMYNDIKNLILLIGDDTYARHYLTNSDKPYIKIGFKLNQHTPFEEQFYRMAGVPIEFKWSKFHINRNMDREREIFDSFGLKPKEYVFTHFGGHRPRPLNTQFRIIEPNGHGLFEWMYVIENAAEIHCMDSSFLCLADCMELDKDIKLFIHRYIRNYPRFILISFKKDWKLVY